MPAEILQFEKSDAWYVERAKYWSRRGVLAKSLLYAYMPKGNGRDVMLCRARILYESGNLSPALRVLVALRDGGERSGEMYALLVKCLGEMTRYRSAEYFMREAEECGAIKFSVPLPETMTRSDYMRSVYEIKQMYPDNKYAGEVSGVLYVLERSVSGPDESLAAEMMFDAHDYAGSEMMFKATGVFYPEKLIPPLARKLAEACRAGLEATPEGKLPRSDLLSTLAVALAACGEEKEARETAEMIVDCDFPDDDIDLVKAVAALVSLGCTEDSRYFLDELCAVQPTESVLLVAAESEIRSADWDAARDRLARCRLVAPNNRLAADLLEKVDARKSNVGYGIGMPESYIKRQQSRIVKYAASDVRDPSPEKTLDALRSLLEVHGEPARAAAELMAEREECMPVFAEYLLDIEGWQGVKREILYRMMLAGRRGIPLYSAGYRVASPSDDVTAGASEKMRQAYLRAYSTCIVYCKQPFGLDEVFAEASATLSRYTRRQNFVFDAAAVLIAMSGADLQFPGLDRSVLFVGSDKDTIDRILESGDSRVVYDFGEGEEEV